MCKKCVIDENDDSDWVEIRRDKETEEVTGRTCKCLCEKDMVDLNDPSYVFQTYAGEPVPDYTTYVCDNYQHGIR